VDLGADSGRIITSRLPSPLQPVAHFAADREWRENGGPAYLFVGRLIERKRPLELIRAFGVVSREIPEATLTVIGDGPLRGEVEREILETKAKVTLLPCLEGDDLSYRYSAADILVAPPPARGMGTRRE
jgi:glycogen synthase